MKSRAFKIFKLFILLSLFSCGNESKKEEGWNDDRKSDFTVNCEKGLMNNPEIDAKSYCSCMLDKVMDKYPDGVDPQKMDIDWMLKEAQNCLGNDAPPLEDEIMEEANVWDEINKSTFIGQCREDMAALDIDTEAYCDCMLEKIIVKYPTPLDAANIDQNWMETVAEECMNP